MSGKIEDSFKIARLELPFTCWGGKYINEDEFMQLNYYKVSPLMLLLLNMIRLRIYVQN